MLNVLFGEYLSDIILLDRNKSMGIDDIIKKILELNGNRFVEFKDRENKEDLFKICFQEDLFSILEKYKADKSSYFVEVVKSNKISTEQVAR
jgi:hypothetical protein